jgi:hypothetical protein
MPFMFTKAHRNAVFGAVVAGGLDPVAYDIDFPFGSFAIDHRPTLSTFTANRSNGYWLYKRKLGSDPEISRGEGQSWNQLLREVGKWGRGVAEGEEVPDLWATLSVGSTVPGDLSPRSDNTHFTTAGQSAISPQLKEIAEFIKKTYELTARQAVSRWGHVATARRYLKLYERVVAGAEWT